MEASSGARDNIRPAASAGHEGSRHPVVECQTLCIPPFLCGKQQNFKARGIEELAPVEELAPGQPMMYEAAYTDNKSKHHEVLGKADGTETRE
jgi:hypothetical protein